jgi:hypothetical protein
LLNPKPAPLLGEWANPERRRVRGLADEDIHPITDRFTLAGWTVEQTRADVQTAIDGSRRKGFAARARRPEHRRSHSPLGQARHAAAAARPAAESDRWGVLVGLPSTAENPLRDITPQMRALSNQLPWLAHSECPGRGSAPLGGLVVSA